MPTFQELLDAAKAQYDALAAENAALKKVPAPVPAPAPAPTTTGIPVQTKAPSFGVGPFAVGSSITRVVGTYTDSTPTAGRRYRNNVLIPGATGAAYTIQQADVGQSLIYEEEATHNTSGTKKWFKSAAVKGVAAVVSPGDTSGTWSTAAVQDAIQNSIGRPNEGRIMGAANGSPGWLSGGAMAFGGEWRNLDRYWNWDTFGRDDYFWFQYLEWWAVIFTEEGSSGDGWVEVKDMEFQILYKGENSWTRICPKAQQMGWGDLYTPNGSGFDTNGGTPQTRAGSEGGTSIFVPYGKSPHFTAVPRTQVPRVDQIEGVICTMLARLDPRNTNAGFKALTQVGGDPKPSPSPGTDGVGGAYVPVAVSQTRRVMPEWRRITCSNVINPNDGAVSNPAYVRRTMSAERFLAVRPLA